MGGIGLSGCHPILKRINLMLRHCTEAGDRLGRRSSGMVPRTGLYDETTPAAPLLCCASAAPYPHPMRCSDRHLKPHTLIIATYGMDGRNAGHRKPGLVPQIAGRA